MNTEQRLASLFDGELDVEHVSHPPDAILLGHHWGVLGDEETEIVAVHLATCNPCSARMIQLQADSVWQTRPEFLPDPRKLFLGGERRGDVRLRREHLLEREAKTGGPPRGMMWMPALLYAGVLAGVALAIGVTHVILNRLLVPPVSPFASPAEISRWWVHLYWLLVPVALLLCWRLVRTVRTGRGDGT